MRGCECEFCCWIRTWSLQTWPASPIEFQPRRPGGRKHSEAQSPVRATQFNCAARASWRSSMRATLACCRFRQPSEHPDQNHCDDVDTAAVQSVPCAMQTMHPVRYTPNRSQCFHGECMKSYRLYFVALAVAIVVVVPAARVSAQPGAPDAAAAPDPNSTLRYIHGSWDSLARSMTSCESLADVKVRESAAAKAVLYLPAEVSV